MAFGHEIGPQLLIVQTCAGQVGKNTAKGNATKKQRLKFLYDRQIQQDTADGDHHKILPAAGGKCGENRGKTAVIP